MTLYRVPSVLDRSECDRIIAESTGRLRPAGVLGPETDFRIADCTWTRQPEEVVAKVRSAVAEQTGLPSSHQELIHIVRYQVGGGYKPHDDAFHKGTEYYDSAMSVAGQRPYSCMIWLNDNFTGGETEFTHLGQTFTASAGDMLIWSNLTTNGDLDVKMRHAGLPVLSGEKWIALIWVRERPMV